MSMTKTDYEMIAFSLRRTHQVIDWTGKNSIKRIAQLKALNLAAIDICVTLAYDNPKFDKVKFLIECGVE